MHIRLSCPSRRCAAVCASSDVEDHDDDRASRVRLDRLCLPRADARGAAAQALVAHGARDQ
eukprot:5085507-Pleurochrysis_carterae.AAC.3